MTEHSLTPEQVAAYGLWLRREEHAPGTVEKYLRDIRAFAAWLDGRPVTRELAAAWKEHLLATSPAPSTPCWPPSTAFSAFWDWSTG